MKPVDREKASVYSARGEVLYRIMQFAADEPDHYGEAVTLLAVHAAIAYTDAILIANTGQRSIDQDHRRVVDELQSLCDARRIETGGLRHLTWLLSHKTDFSYGERRARTEEVLNAAQHFERYFAWMYTRFAEIVRQEGPS